MNLTIITGSYPPDVCGVGDYTARLMATETAKDWTVYSDHDWGIGSLRRHIRAINAMKSERINMQYPAEWYGWSLVPHLLTVYYSWFTRKRFSVTIHEQIQMSLKAYLAELIMLATANKIIFTNQFEKNFAVRRMPWIERRCGVVKIFSNIGSSGKNKPIGEREISVAYFGQIRPIKGIEKFISDMEAITGQHKVMLIGQVPDGFEGYAAGVVKAASEVGIEVRANLADEEVSALLRNTRVAYLPFPDGASERRGSLLASMTNGAIVASTIGRFTTPELADAIVDIDKTSVVDVLFDSSLLIGKQKKAGDFLESQMPHSWDEVATNYVNFLSV